MNEYIKFILNGSEISFIAEAPKDITLEQLLKQCDKIKPDWCACGICSYIQVFKNDQPVEIHIDYDDVYKVDKDASCAIKEEDNGWGFEKLEGDVKCGYKILE